MTKRVDIARVRTGIRNLDALLKGGLPAGSVSVVGGSPGAGKTTLALQLCFNAATPKHRALCFGTLSEPTAKTLRYLSQFDFFDPQKLNHAVEFIDLGLIVRSKGLEQASKLLLSHVKKFKPAFVVIDSFKVFDDLAESKEELRKFAYELAVNLMAWETTALLLGEFGPEAIATNPLFSIVDGLILLAQREHDGEQQRLIQIVKMRGTNHSRDEHPFVITEKGIEVFAAGVTIKRDDRASDEPRCKTGISRLDQLLGEGIPRGSSLLVGGVAGTGKTVLLLEFIYRGAIAGEKGIVFSFEETEARLRAAARGLGWDLDHQIARGMVEIVFIAQPDIVVEAHLLMMHERIEAMRARRVVVDSISVFLHKIKDPQTDREKVFQLASVVQNAQAVGLFATDIAYGSGKISRFGVEETVVDGVILLTSTEERLERERYIEVYKLRNTAHLKGRHSMTIGPGGLVIFPRYTVDAELQMPPSSVHGSVTLASGVPGLDTLLGGGLRERSVTLLSGAAGIGKTTISLQFIAEGAKARERGLYVALEEGPAQIMKTAEALALPLKQAVKRGILEVAYLPREHIRATQLVAILADKIRTNGVRRLVLDGVSQILGETAPEMVRDLLFALAKSFKSLGVTSLFTLESNSMYSTESVTNRNLSPIADNLVVLRYLRVGAEIRPTLMVVKTRTAVHGWNIHFFTIAKGGVRIGDPVEGKSRPTNKSKETQILVPAASRKRR
ncbi:MAG: AAA family ATPase [Myxococcota bacterium]|nr:AAA family ATPase [Myxococcota bacterium]